MIVNHSENVNYIYHYTSIKNYLSIMSSRYILLSDLSRSDDLRERNISSNKKVACFCCGGDECDKPLMWSKYAENETGVCIKFDLGKIMEVNGKLGKFEGIKVKYKPSKFFTTRQDSGVELEYKHIGQEHQNEYRFVSSEIDRLLINKECVKGVIFGGSVESVEDDDVNKVVDLTKRAGLLVGVVSVNGSRFEMPKVVKGDMDFDTFSFEAGKLRDSAFADTDIIDLEIENIRMSAGSDKIMEEYDKLLLLYKEVKAENKKHIKNEEKLRKRVEELELLIKKEESV